MKKTLAIEILRDFNKWRRGDDSVKTHSPEDIGTAIDVCVSFLTHQNVRHGDGMPGNRKIKHMAKRSYLGELSDIIDDLNKTIKPLAYLEISDSLIKYKKTLSILDSVSDKIKRFNHKVLSGYKTLEYHVNKAKNKNI